MVMISLKRPLTLYLDTSIPNFLFAEDAQEKQKFTQMFFQNYKSGYYELYISGVVLREIEKSTLQLRSRLLEVIQGIEVLPVNHECETLAQTYISQRALPSSSIEDARHVAVATVYNLDAVVSWNFKHLVNLRRIKAVNLINEAMGYKHIEIISPLEVVAS
jgi:predicted nucleic acid-binding protein